MSYLEVHPGITLNYIDVGPGDAKPVVLLHAWSFNHRVWGRQINSLSTNYRVIAVDLRGHGASSKPAAGYEPADVARDVEMLLDHLDLQAVALVGWSLGGAVASVVASHSTRLSHLMLVAPFGPHYLNADDSPYGPTADQVSSVLEQEALSPEVFRMGSVTGMPKEPYADETRQWLFGLSLEAPSWSAGRLLAEFVKYDFRPHLADIRVPTLVCQGAADVVAPEAGIKDYAERVAEARIHTFEESGHSPSIEQSEEFLEVFLKFVTE